VTPEEDHNASPASSKQVLKFGYHSGINRLIRKVPVLIPGPHNAIPQASAGFGYENPLYKEGDWSSPDSNVAILRQSIGTGVLKPNTNYLLSFRVKGTGVKPGRAAVGMGGWLIRDTSKAKTYNPNSGVFSSESQQEEFTFPVTPSWNVVTRTLNFRFKENDLNTPDRWSKPGTRIEYRGFLDIRAAINIDEGELYIDNVQLVPM
jgi:hypothetical protein